MTSYNGKVNNIPGILARELDKNRQAGINTHTRVTQPKGIII